MSNFAKEKEKATSKKKRNNVFGKCTSQNITMKNTFKKDDV
jgi:hypothetical protein